MKTTAVATTLLAVTSMAAASPVLNLGFGIKINFWKENKGDKNFRDLKDVLKPAYFTSTYQCVATPDQVVNATASTPGEPGAIGYYNFGINSALDVICYVSQAAPLTGR